MIHLCTIATLMFLQNNTSQKILFIAARTIQFPGVVFKVCIYLIVAIVTSSIYFDVKSTHTYRKYIYQQSKKIKKRSKGGGGPLVILFYITLFVFLCFSPSVFHLVTSVHICSSLSNVICLSFSPLYFCLFVFLSCCLSVFPFSKLIVHFSSS